MKLPPPSPRYDAQNEAALRLSLEQTIGRLEAQVADLTKQIQTQKFGLGVLPSGQQAAIPSPTGGATVDTEARAAIDAIRSGLATFGFIAP